MWLELGSATPREAQHAAAAAYGKHVGFSFRAVSGQSNASTQAGILKQLADQHTSVVMLNPVDPKALVPAVQYAESKGTKVLAVYSVVQGATASAVFNELRSGRVAAINAVKLLTQRYGKPQGRSPSSKGILGQTANDLRAQGFIDYMKTQPGIKVEAEQPTGWTAAQAASTMQDWLVKYPSLSMVYGLSDTITVPALNVAQRQNRVCTAQSNWTKNSNCIIFVSLDGSFIQDRKRHALRTKLNSPYWTGATFAQYAWDLAKGKPVAKTTTVNSMLVTPQNVTCVTKMATDIRASSRRSTSTGSLQQIASKTYHCTVLDANE